MRREASIDAIDQLSWGSKHTTCAYNRQKNSISLSESRPILCLLNCCPPSSSLQLSRLSSGPRGTRVQISACSKNSAYLKPQMTPQKCLPSIAPFSVQSCMIELYWVRSGINLSRWSQGSTSTTRTSGEQNLKAEKVYSMDQRHWTVNAGMAVGEVFG